MKKCTALTLDYYDRTYLNEKTTDSENYTEMKFENPGRYVLFLVTLAWRIRNWQSSTVCMIFIP